MSKSGAIVQRGSFGASMRRDAWWLELVPVIIVLGAFSIYATWRTFENNYYEWGPYLSPFYSPHIKPSWWPLSPAVLILWAARISGDLLLLPQGLLPRFLSRSSCVCC